jgi:serine/threonine protein kinase/tetratricopeptide (TPR) repeat protein
MEADDDKTRTHVVLTKGTMVSHYKITGKLGAGGMGEVFLAQDTELDRTVALKFLPPHLCQDEDCRKRFKREAQAAAKLSHPNIVTIHEVGEHQTRPYFVMEHVEGRSLRDMKGEELDLDRIVGIAIQLCDGLQMAHAAGVIHRDIKPSNIVIDSSGRPKLLDFGLATVKGGEHLTKTGSTLGTVGYMSPEQIEGKETDAKSDLFSLGVVLYELIANKSPFRRDDETATLKAILHDAPEPLARYKSDVPDDLQRIVTKLLEKDPSLRYQSASGVIPDLKKLAPSRTSGVVVEKKRDWWNRYVVPSALAVLLIVLGFWYFSGREQPRGGSIDRERKMLAVLPFENLGSTEDDGFADGITDAITSRIAKISGLGVIARTSVLQYKGTTKRIREIGAELGVDYILEGTILWDQSTDTTQVRIIPQLIQVSDESHLWTDTYERALTGIFAVQADIATSVAENLNISLLQPERDALSSQPTNNMEAYTYYLRGVAYRNEFEIELAEQMILKSVTLDTTFAEAFAELSYLNSYQYFFASTNQIRNDREQILAERYAQKALELDPGGLSTLKALGYYNYYVHNDDEKALKFFERGLLQEPNNAELLYARGKLHFRFSQFEKAYDALRRASIVDPGNSTYSEFLAYNCLYSRKGDEAIAVLNSALSFNPNDLRLHRAKVQITSFYCGSPVMVKEAIDDAISQNPDFANIYASDLSCLEYEFLTRNYGKIISETLSQGLQGAKTYMDTTYLYYLQLTVYYYLLSDTINSRIYADTLRQRYESNIEFMQTRGTGVETNRAYMSFSYFLLGDREKGLRFLDEAYDSRPLDRDGLSGPWNYLDLSSAYIMMGVHDRGLDMTEELLRRPSPLTAAFMRISPTYDPLRDHPRFQALLEKYGGDQAGI